MYQNDELGEEFRQGEIISDLLYYDFNPANEEMEDISFSFGIIANQDCDLLRDHEAFVGSQGSVLIGILIFPASPCEVARSSVGNSETWRRVKKNDNDRYHVFQSIPLENDLLGQGIPDLLVDFRKFILLTPLQLRWQIENGVAKRRSRLIPTYREHLQNRMCNYLSRVSLEAPHAITT